MYRAAIVDDDPLSQEVLNDIIDAHFQDYKVCGVYGSVADALSALPTLEFDVLFLDMELEDGFGFDILKALGEVDFEVVIITMYDSFMLEAIKHSALDYLMKPITVAALADAISRFEQRMAKRKAQEPAHGMDTLRKKRLVIPNQQGLLLVELDHIIRMESEGAYTLIVLTDGARHLASKNLGFYENQLAHHDFIRVHHGHLIHMEHVVKYVKGEGGHVVMTDGTLVNVSRRRKDEFMRRLAL